MIAARLAALRDPGSAFWVQLQHVAAGLTGLVVTPLVFRALGDSAFGLYVFLLELLSYLSVLSKGLHPNLIRRLACSEGAERRRALGEYFRFEAFVFLMMLAMAALILPGLAAGSPWSLGLQVALMTAANLLAAMLSLSWYAAQRFRRYALFESAFPLLNGACVVLLYLTGALTLQRLILLGLVLAFTRLLAVFLLLRDELELRRPWLQFPLIHAEWRSIGSFFLITLGAYLIFYSDGVVTGFTLGAEAAGWLVVQYKLARHYQTLIWNLADARYPAFSRLYRQNHWGDYRRAVWGEFRRLLAWALFGLGVLLVAGPGFYAIWMGPQFPFDPALHVIISLVIFLYALSHFFGVLANAAGLEGRVARFVLAEGILNLGLSLLFVRYWGLRGIVLATLAAHLLATGPAMLFLVIVPLCRPLAPESREGRTRERPVESEG